MGWQSGFDGRAHAQNPSIQLALHNHDTHRAARQALQRPFTAPGPTDWGSACGEAIFHRLGGRNSASRIGNMNVPERKHPTDAEHWQGPAE